MKITSLIVCALILSFGITFATSNPDIPVIEDEVRMIITGTVTDIYTGDAVPNADVTLNDTGESTTTDEYGTFTFDEVETGEYTLSIDAPGYATAEVEVEVVPEGARIEVQLEPEED